MQESPWKIRAFLAFQKGKVRQKRGKEVDAASVIDELGDAFPGVREFLRTLDLDTPMAFCEAESRALWKTFRIRKLAGIGHDLIASIESAPHLADAISANGGRLRTSDCVTRRKRQRRVLFGASPIIF
jgi:hypothetical protein